MGGKRSNQVIGMSVSASVIAHGVHYGVLAVGAAVLVALLGPQLVGSRRRPDDEHTRRVDQLAEQIAAGALGTSLTSFAPAPAPALPRVTTSSSVSTLLAPVAIISSAAAAGVHAAVGPEHFKESLLFGSFFAGSALAQIIWASVMVTRPTRWLVEAAVLGNVSVVCLWLVTRTIGLGALLPVPEAFGPWDLCCAFWEIGVVVACIALLRSPHPVERLQVARWAEWHPAARTWAVASVLILGLLTVSGAGA